MLQAGNGSCESKLSITGQFNGKEDARSFEEVNFNSHLKKKTPEGFYLPVYTIKFIIDKPKNVGIKLNIVSLQSST